MKYGRYGWPYLLLRVGLGLTFIYMGIDVFRHPEAWIAYVGSESLFGFNQDALLRFGGVFDLVVGLMLIVKIMPKLSGWLAAVHLVGIFIGNGVDTVLSRNVGLLGMAIAIAVWPSSYHRKKHKWSKRSKRSSSGDDEGA